eukprot:4962964-Amphidinium_carterae.1
MSTANKNHKHMELNSGMMLKLMEQRRVKMARVRVKTKAKIKRERTRKVRQKGITLPSEDLPQPRRHGKCLRCGGKGHSVQECRRPRRDKPAPKPQPKPGKGASDAKWAEGDLAQGESDYVEGTTIGETSYVETHLSFAVVEVEDYTPHKTTRTHDPHHEASPKETHPTLPSPLLDTGATVTLQPIVSCP